MNAGNWSRMVAGVLCATWTAAPVLAEDAVWSAPQVCAPQVRVETGDCSYMIQYDCGEDFQPRWPAAFFSAGGQLLGSIHHDPDFEGQPINENFTFVVRSSFDPVLEAEPTNWAEVIETGSTGATGAITTRDGDFLSEVSLNIQISEARLFDQVDGVDVYTAIKTRDTTIHPIIDTTTGEPINPDEEVVTFQNEDVIFFTDTQPVLQSLRQPPTAITPATSPDFTLAPLPQCLETE